jgi:hypothetical protein
VEKKERRYHENMIEVIAGEVVTSCVAGRVYNL